MREPVIVDVVRTTFGKRGGALANWHPADLLGFALTTLLERTGVDPERIDDVIGGCVSQVGEQSTNLARNGWVSAGLPQSVPATTVDRQCGSSQQAVHFAAAGVAADHYDLVIACGAEVMSRVPLASNARGRHRTRSLLPSWKRSTAGSGPSSGSARSWPIGTASPGKRWMLMPWNPTAVPPRAGTTGTSSARPSPCRSRRRTAPSRASSSGPTRASGAPRRSRRWRRSRRPSTGSPRRRRTSRRATRHRRPTARRPCSSPSGRWPSPWASRSGPASRISPSPPMTLPSCSRPRCR